MIYKFSENGNIHWKQPFIFPILCNMEQSHIWHGSVSAYFKMSCYFKQMEILQLYITCLKIHSETCAFPKLKEKNNWHSFDILPKGHPSFTQHIDGTTNNLWAFQAKENFWVLYKLSPKYPPKLCLSNIKKDDNKTK